jgi:hypothetical protein
MTIEKYRFAWAMSKMREGVPTDIAVMSAFAAHPFDDSPPGPIPDRVLEKRVRKMSRRYAKEVRKVGEDHFMLGKLVGSTLKVYERLAIEAQNMYYIDRYSNAADTFIVQLVALGHITGPEVTPELQALADQYEADRFTPGDSQ